MSELSQAFVAHLIDLNENDRGALAHLRRSLGFPPGNYPRVYPYVERFAGGDRASGDPWREALYVTGGIFALHPMHAPGVSFATALGRTARERGSSSIEQRFIALLESDSEGLPVYLRQAASLLAADGMAVDYVRLLEDLSYWLSPIESDARDRVRSRWARDFYRAFDRQPLSEAQ
jgi:CRISPR system Cascade subunit CasB